MPKRVPLKVRRDQDKKGVDVLFESPEPTTQKKTTTKRGQGSKKAQNPVKEQNGEMGPLMKATYYIRPEQDEALDEIKLAVRRKTGEKKDKSELIREAIDLLKKKYSVTA